MAEHRYLVAARKYRPMRFNELIAQGHVTETLKNALRLDRLAHAYLFSGPRGVGKTTAARILAKAINCETPLEERPDRAEPCRTCPSCRTFEEGRSLGIFELDAASNNKVDDIRELRDTVRIPPQGSKRKVYIIDEVHMLSNQAFNALLKTLEEPPPHVLFIFATTEPHKVLPTILSRCQRFDFRRIPVPDITRRLREICEEEGITADEESLMLLARKGDGALRDALSAFDQAVSLCGTELEYPALAQAMGVVDRDLFFRLTEHVAAGNSAGMLALVERVVRAGYDLQEFLTGVAEHLRNLLVARTMDELALIEAAEATRVRYAEHARPFAEADLLRLLMIAGEAEQDVKQSTQPRLKLEMALLQMARLPHAADLRQALQQLARLEALARAGKLPASVGKGERGKGGKDEAPSPDDVSEDEPAAASSPKYPTPAEDETSTAEQQVREPEDKPEAAPEAAPETKPERTAASGSSDEYRSLFGTPALQRTQASEEDAATSGQDDPTGAAPSHARDASQSAAPTATLAPEAPAAEAALPATLPAARAEQWSEVVQSVPQDRVQIGTLLKAARPLGVDGGTLRIAVPNDLSRQILRNEKRMLFERLSGAAGEQMEQMEQLEQLRFVVRADLAAQGDGETAPEANPYELLDRMRTKHPVVRALFDEFGGEPVH